MNQYIAKICLLVGDYDEAIEFYTKKLGFTLLEDIEMGESKRWVVIAPKGQGGCSLLLAKASNERQVSQIGNQSGGRVFLFLYTDNLERDYGNLLKNAVKIIRQPRDEPYGKVLVFEDIYGNQWDMIEPTKA
ncbi:MAG: VOC family protein [Bacteroidales bacterium]|nr:VOC family protein [Bacteroidales bacterium]